MLVFFQRHGSAGYSSVWMTRVMTKKITSLMAMITCLCHAAGIFTSHPLSLQIRASFTALLHWPIHLGIRHQHHSLQLLQVLASGSMSMEQVKLIN